MLFCVSILYFSSLSPRLDSITCLNYRGRLFLLQKFIDIFIEDFVGERLSVLMLIFGLYLAAYYKTIQARNAE